jgi:endonuclease YncB( thermonuclease family)
LIPVLAATLFATAAYAQDFKGKVVAVLDGDTFSILHEGRAEKVRLAGVDCPEKGQPFGSKAKQFTSALVFGQLAQIKVYGRDRYGRTLGDAVLADGRVLSKELIRAGYAWWYRR